MKIGAIVRLGPAAEGQAPQDYRDIRAAAQRVESAGFDSLWVYDHLLYRWPGRPTAGIWECWTMLSALAEATHRVELGTLVVCTQFRNPAVLAKMAVTLDEVSGGRLTLGLGAGWHEPEFDAFGIPFDHRATRFEEAMHIIAPLIRTGQVDFNGQYCQARDCEIVPRGPRPEGIPLLLAGKGPRMLRLVARFADSWNTAWHGQPDSAVAPIAQMREVCAAEGRDPATLDITVAVGVAYPDLGPPGGPARAPLSGSAVEIADALARYQELGVAHVIIEVAPYVPAAIDRLAEAVRLVRS